jgi:uncharacterized cysteine cluster protein YcgN (CxxCxxCC family)
MQEQPFWKRKTLSEMDRTEWELLCDGCARCCLYKLEDETLKQVRYTSVACRLLDTASCRCSSYWNRHALVPTCMVLTPSRVEQYYWLPPTCAYRLLHQGKDLPDWHHLVCGDRESVHESGHSVKGKVVSEDYIPSLELSEHVVEWE